ncbi:MAG: rod shape-determining protein MreC [Desulfobacteraceae bacterium]|nr:rod shape-determining protein MreC [Desulfobacteraceae bacterium]
MFSKKTAMIVGVIIVFAVNVTFIFFIQSRNIGVGDISVSLTAPFQEAFTKSVHFVRDIWHHYFFLVSAAKTNDNLKKALSRIVEKENQYKETNLANDRIRKLLEFRRTIADRVVAAEIIGKDPSPWFKSIIIDKGWKDEIKKGLPVLVPEGIVGMVTDVSPNYSKVLLIIDQNSSVDALIQDSRAWGIIRGKSSSECIFKYVLRKHEIRTGDTVISSGLDGVFPKGVRVGEVSKVTKHKTGAIFQEVFVSPYVDFEKLEEVLIILKSEDLRR